MERIYLETVDSTNKWAKEHIEEIKDMTVVLTHNQTAGRGRLNRKWDNVGSDNIFASIVLKPSNRMKSVYSALTQFLCVVIAKTIEEYDVETQIKWPNDIKINDKKVCGILAEAVTSGESLKGIILGFGINLNVPETVLSEISQPATALNIAAGQSIDKNKFLESLLNRFCLLYDKFIGEGFSFIREEYKKRACFLNEKISVRVFDKVINGVAVDITGDGALILKDNNKREHILLMGDIL